jgi:energy-coupling factor transporter transmembrane protein EcfT
MAMDSRGFDSRSPRTAARRQHVRPSDRVLVASVAALVLAANLLAVAVGVWHPLLG